MLKKIIFSISLGIFSTIFFLQYDSWTHKKIIEYMKHIAQESLKSDFSADIQSISFFSPSIVLHNMEMKPRDSDLWSWRCKKCEISCSWLQLLFKGVLEQYITIDGFMGESNIYHSRLAIEQHLIAMMKKPFIYCATELKSIILKNSHFTIKDESQKIKFFIDFTASSLKMDKYSKISISINDGSISHQNTYYVEKIGLDLSILINNNDSIDVSLQSAGTCILSHMSNHGGCYLTGSWNSNRGRFSLCNVYNVLTIDPLIITEKEIRLSGHFPLSYVMQCMRNSEGEQIIDGTAHFIIKVDRESLCKIDGQIVMENIVINQIKMCDVVKIVFERDEDTYWKMHLALSRENKECKGYGYWHESERKGELFLDNNTDLSSAFFNYWRIKHKKFFMHMYAHDSIIEGSYQATMTHLFNELTHSVKGTLLWMDKELLAQGFIDEEEFVLETTVEPQFQLNHCSYKDKDKKELFSLESIKNTKKMQGLISFAAIRSIINNFLHYDVQGEGNVEVIADIGFPEISADIILKDATIRLPQTYNFIDGFKARGTYNIINKSAVFEDINLSLHTGKVNCLRATMNYNEKGSLLFMHAPFILNHCLLNIKRDLFAIVSGHLLFSKSLTLPAQVSGHIFIDKAQLKENLFSGLIQKQLVSYTHSVFSLPDVALHCDLVVESKSPISVDTGFLQTNAQINIQVKKEKHDPCVSGSIILHAGMLNFPYKPLYISRGIITFIPDQLFDPTIEFIARNKIKKYDISLQVEGSLLAQHIMLDATPALLEEQIVGLLLVGSEENSLNSMMPALIVQNLKNLIFSNNQLSFFDKYFKPFLGSLNINLVPSFADQTGRGGLKGALEITVDDRWRAMIQKNFSLTEDTKFELEYLFSDDITFRAIRDERRDLGAEVEMRWKF